jgi:hypothetical protein
MKRVTSGLLFLPLALVLGACGDDVIQVVDEEPAAPRNLSAWYYNRAVYLTWELAPAWNGEVFRI